ncbi:MAG TPA: DUF4215 domain-containing protein, partial [Polyangiaceae bacterium]|nr:DUF4215 domain-containing protein [Polyangiaceae bacterium]
MSRTRWFAATSTAFLLISYLVGGCAEGGDEPSGGGSGGKQNPTCSCQPGTTATCDCPGGGKGVQTCEIDCVSYTTCDCSDAGATGGSGGTGGGSTGEMGGSGGQNTGGSPTGGAGGEAASGGSAGSAGAAAGSAGSAGATGDVDVCPGEPLHLSGSGSSIRQGSATGDTSTLTHDYLGNCGSALSKDAVYVVTPDVDGVLRADLGGSEATSFDSILYARTDCTDQDSEIVCDDTYVKGSEKLEFDVLKNTPYYLFVDGYNKEAGPYELNVQVIPKGCGNGIKEPGEDCDDGNQIDDDWCHNDCTINPNPAGDTCPGMTMALTGTGTQDRVGTIAGDTSSFSSSYSSSKCVSSSTASAKDFVALVKPDVDGTMTCDLGGSTATPWDSVLYVRSQCDNVSSELACNDSASTGAEKVTLPVVKNTPYYVFVDGYGAAKSGPFVLTCTIKVAYCGNGTVEGTEECDDGNNTSGDGCSSSCKIEPKGPADICPGKTLQLKESNGTYIAFETGSTTGQTHAYVGTCGGTSTAPDQVYKFNSGVGGRVTVSIPTEGTT